MKRLRRYIGARAFVLALAAHISACATQSAHSDPVITDVEINFEAGARFYQSWSSGNTIHSGKGYIHPFGASDYWCGAGYAEEAGYPDIREEFSQIIDNSVDTNPLFCIYRTSAGDMHVLDVLIGSISAEEGSIERVDTVVNIVVGGTGHFQSASGVWVGTTMGRGAPVRVTHDLELPESILKLMDGYVRTGAK